MEDLGYGVAGHKNVYSKSCLVGAYCEERLSEEAVFQLQQQQACFPKSVNQETFIDPRNMEDKTVVPHSAPLPSTNEVKNKIRMGVPFKHLFYHVSNADQLAELNEERFKTVAENSYGIAGTRQDMMRKRLSQQARSQRQDPWHTASRTR